MGTLESYLGNVLVVMVEVVVVGMVGLVVVIGVELM